MSEVGPDTITVLVPSDRVMDADRFGALVKHLEHAH